jgi:hypothetical protein
VAIQGAHVSPTTLWLQGRDFGHTEVLIASPVPVISASCRTVNRWV